ncbi:MAG: hypothetical protein FGM31_03210 [Candidatus Methylopumilus sp.]|nr:hypothetical protein [Candidatus Methylopumilus sp.]
MNLLNKYSQLASKLLIALSLTIASAAYAGPGHGEEKPTTTQAQALPRFYAESDLYEAVGVINGKEITLYLDRYSSNELVKGAKVEIELEGSKISSEPHGDGEYLFRLKNKIKDQPTAITITINDDVTDILAATIDLSSFERSSLITWKSVIKILLYFSLLMAIAYFSYRKKEVLMTHTKKLIKQIQERV